MRKLFLGLSLIAMTLASLALASTSGPSMPADDAVKLLKEGNARYVAGQSAHPRQGADRREETVKGGQHPIATIIGCSDSREPLEVLFDQGVGDLFVVRVAGNVAGPDELATVEYGVGHLGTPVVLVLGHTSCGAVTAAVQNAKVHGNLPFLINQIKPAVARAKSWSPMASGDDLLNKSIKSNVWLTMENLLRKSHEVKERVKKGQLLVIGGIYDLNAGTIDWLGQHPDQAKLLVETHAPVHAKPKAKAPEGEAAPDAGGAMIPEANAHGEQPKKAPAHQ